MGWGLLSILVFVLITKCEYQWQPYPDWRKMSHPKNKTRTFNSASLLGILIASWARQSAVTILHKLQRLEVEEVNIKSVFWWTCLSALVCMCAVDHKRDHLTWWLSFPDLSGRWPGCQPSDKQLRSRLIRVANLRTLQATFRNDSCTPPTNPNSWVSYKPRSQGCLRSTDHPIRIPRPKMGIMWCITWIDRTTFKWAKMLLFSVHQHGVMRLTLRSALMLSPSVNNLLLRCFEWRSMVTILVITDAHALRRRYHLFNDWVSKYKF